MRDESASAARQRDFDGRGCWVSERSLGAGDQNVVGCLIPRDRQRARREGSAPFPVAAGPDQGTSAQGARWTLERGVQPVAQLRDGGGRWAGEQSAVSGQSDAQDRAWACHRCKRCSRRRIGGRGGDELLPPSFGIARIAGGDQSPRLGRGKAARRRAPQPDQRRVSDNLGTSGCASRWVDEDHHAGVVGAGGVAAADVGAISGPTVVQAQDPRPAGHDIGASERHVDSL